MPSRYHAERRAGWAAVRCEGWCLYKLGARPNGPLLLVTLDVGADTADTGVMNATNITSIYRNSNGNVALLTCDGQDNAVSASVSELPLMVDGKSGREIDTLIRQMGFIWFCNQGG